MAHKPSTHRQEENLAHGLNGCAVSPEHDSSGRLNNAALVTEPDLLHFGIDFMRLCLGVEKNYQSDCIGCLSSLFLLPHNDTNAASYKNMLWPKTEELVDLSFAKTKNGEGCYVHWNGWLILVIEKLSPDSSFFNNIRGKYLYVVSLYGDFFASQKLGLDIVEFLALFREDICEGLVVHTVSRLDICCDWSVLNVSDVARGIHVLSPTHAKPFTPMNTDWETGIPETYYYGKPTDKRWHARIYNKNLNNEDKGKEALFPNYWGIKTVTRLELELREVCREFRIDFLNCWDDAFLLSVVKSLLDTKYVKWDVVPLLIKKMKEKGHGYFNAKRVYFNYSEMSKFKFYKQTMRKNLACIKRLDVPIAKYLESMSKDLAEEMRVISRQTQ